MRTHDVDDLEDGEVDDDGHEELGARRRTAVASPSALACV